ncbi:hypothetical protein BCV64_15425 [Cylindrospermopsis raciborskii MVCC14]|nr:hypothetical protein BCV64_15425 [Cylindrospermopsis raciborskii MVCC14]
MTNIQSPKLTSPKLTAYEFKNLPLLGTTTTNQNILLGGFSGLYFQGVADNGNLQFVTHTDRGPNSEPTGQNRPFLLPNFQPEIVSFELNKASGEINITNRTKLFRADGKTPLTGIPNVQAGAGNTAYTDEIGVNLNGTVLNNDPLGADLEGIVIADNGDYWMVDEYRPAIYHFNRNGILVSRFIPQGTASKSNQPVGTFGIEVLPEVYAQRRNNRGFEAVALAGNKLYAFIQTPIDNPDNTGDTTSRSSRNLRILEFDIVSEKVTGEYLYLLDDITGTGNAKTDKIGDAVFLGGSQFAVVERDDRSDTTSNKLIYQIDLIGATNINNTSKLSLPQGKTIEQLTPVELGPAGITPVNKSLIVNAAQIGYTGVEKLEGLALVSASTLAIVNDNDFVTTIPEKLGIIELPNNLVEVTGTANKDELFVKKGEYVLGLDGDDILDASDGLGNNVLDGGAGNDQLYGGKSDTLIGGAGNDQLYVVEGNNNILYGGAGNDRLFVTEGNNNILYGEDGDDNLYIIEGGNNTLSGGGGADKFYIVNGVIPVVPGQVLDFTRGDDKVIISGISQIQGFDNLILEQNANNTTIKTKDLIGGSQKVLGILKGVVANTLTADDFRINDVTITNPQVSGTFNPIATDNILTQEEKKGGLTLSGTVSDPNAQVTLQFGGQFRVAKVQSSNSSWSYTVTDNDYNFFREGQNQLTAIFTLTNNNRTGTFRASQTLTINSGVLPQPTSPTLDPTKPKGISEAVTQKAQSANIGQGILGSGEKLTDPNIVVIPFGGINTFNQGANAAIEDFGLIKTGSNTTIESVRVFPKSPTGEVSVTLSDGTSVLASIPPGISSIGDPLGLTMSGLVPGGSSTLDFYLPRNILNQLPSDLQSATYAKFNFEAKKFEQYADEQGKPLYQYKFTDKNSNGIRDFGELYLSLNLTDGDKWDSDRIQNGIIVDPGQLGIAVVVTGTGVTYSSTTVNPGNSLIPREAPALSNIADNVFYKFSNTYKPAEARQALQNALGQTDAAFKNIFGLYEIDNATGSVNGIAPGQPGYAKAALDKSKVISNFTVRAGGSVTPNINGDLIGIGDKTYAPFVIANGGNYSGSIQEAINEFFKVNPNNSAATAQNYMGLPVAYFSFGAANPDGAAHIKSVGNNIFGFEDLPAGVGVSDYDFNDMVFSFG